MPSHPINRVPRVLTGKEKGGPPQKKTLPVSTTVLSSKLEGGRSPKGEKTVSTHGVYYVSNPPSPC